MNIPYNRQDYPEVFSTKSRAKLSDLPVPLAAIGSDIQYTLVERLSPSSYCGKASHHDGYNMLASSITQSMSRHVCVERLINNAWDDGCCVVVSRGHSQHLVMKSKVH